MTPVEFAAWKAFYRLYPFDDMHRYYKPAAMIAHASAGGEIADRLEWLQPTPKTHQYSDADMNTLRAFGIKPPAR